MRIRKRRKREMIIQIRNPADLDAILTPWRRKISILVSRYSLTSGLVSWIKEPKFCDWLMV
jgi:hypothetical protein